MAEAGAAVVIEDSELDPGTLPRTVAELFARPRAPRGDGRGLPGLARPDAAERIAEEVLAAAAPRAAGGEQPVTSTEP